IGHHPQSCRRRQPSSPTDPRTHPNAIEPPPLSGLRLHKPIEDMPRFARLRRLHVVTSRSTRHAVAHSLRMHFLRHSSLSYRNETRCLATLAPTPFTLNHRLSEALMARRAKAWLRNRIS